MPLNVWYSLAERCDAWIGEKYKKITQRWEETSKELQLDYWLLAGRRSSADGGCPDSRLNAACHLA